MLLKILPTSFANWKVRPEEFSKKVCSMGDGSIIISCGVNVLMVMKITSLVGALDVAYNYHPHISYLQEKNMKND